MDRSHSDRRSGRANYRWRAECSCPENKDRPAALGGSLNPVARHLYASAVEPTDEGQPRWMDYRRLDELLPALVNAKEHSLPDLRGSIGRFGFLDAIVLDERTERLVGGHGRVELLQALEDLPDGERPDGWPEVQSWPPEGVRVDGEGRWLVPVQRGWRSRDDDEAHAAGIALNRQAELGGWNREVLAGQLDHLAQGPGLDGIGYDLAYRDGLLDDLRATEVFPTGIPEPTRIGLLPPNPRHHVLVTFLDPSAQAVRAALAGLEGAEGVELRWSP